MKQHYFFELKKHELNELKKEYFSSNITIFSKKYNIWNKTLIKLFWKKWRQWICWRHKIVKTIVIAKKDNLVKTIDLFDNDFFNNWLYKKSEDPYYSKIFNKIKNN